MRSIGIEEEFLLVAADGTPQAVAAAVLRHASAKALDAWAFDLPGGALVKEFAQEQVESSTRPCTDLASLLEEVRSGRERADASAQYVGARIAALGTAPQAIDPTVIVNGRERAIAAAYGQIARDQLTCGCHVHVEVADDVEGVLVLDHLRRWAPVLLALSANSPYWRGHDSDYASFRSQVFGRWPTAGPTAPFGDPKTYHRLVDDLMASGVILDTGMVYFDARLSARYPTVEVRVSDVCLDAADAVVQGALVRALADTAVGCRDGLVVGSRVDQPRTELLRVAAWRAARSGLSGDLLDPWTGVPTSAANVVHTLLDHVGPALCASGDRDWVTAAVEELLGRGNGAAQQRRWRDAGADDAALVARAVERTVA
jgi:carboxylate-amine ligase